MKSIFKFKFKTDNIFISDSNYINDLKTVGQLNRNLNTSPEPAKKLLKIFSKVDIPEKANTEFSRLIIAKLFYYLYYSKKITSVSDTNPKMTLDSISGHYTVLNNVREYYMILLYLKIRINIFKFNEDNNQHINIE